MSLTRRKDGRWVKSKTINGERVFFYSMEKSEKKALRDIESQMVSYQGKIERGKTFQEVADEWEEVHYKTIQHQTEHRYKSLVAHVTDIFGEDYIKKITSNDIDLFLKRLAEQGYSSKSLKDQTNIVKMIFKYATIHGYIEQNPAQYISPPKGKPKVTREPLTDEQIRAVESNIDKDFGLLAYFLMYTGLRKGEALALTYGDIDRKNNTISVGKSIEHVNNKPHLKEPKTKAGTRTVPLLNKIKNVLPKGKKNEIIFNQDGGYMTATYYDRHWQNYKKETGLNITAHQLRHTFTTLLFEFGIDMKDSQEILGHSDISTTRNIYTHIRKNRLENTTSLINDRLSAAGF